MTSKDSKDSEQSPVMDVLAVVKHIPAKGPLEQMPDFSGLRSIRRVFTWCLWICVATIVLDVTFAAKRHRTRAIEDARKQTALQAKQREVAVSHEAPPVTVKPALLDRAKAIIPEELKEIYAALNAGNPKGATKFLDAKILADYASLDRICKPFTYRAHYIESMFERAGEMCEVRARVLLQPLSEGAHIFVFKRQGDNFVLSDLEDRPTQYADWFKVEKETAVETARKFMYALSGKRQDVLEKLVTASVPTEPYVTDPKLISIFADCSVSDVQKVDLKNYKGLKIEVVLGLRGKLQGWGSGQASFLFERIGEEQKIVWVAPLSWLPGFGFAKPSPPGTPIRWVGDSYLYPEDAALEARTLARFGLNSGQ